MIIVTTPERLSDWTTNNNNASAELEGSSEAPTNTEVSAANGDGCSAGVARTVEESAPTVNALPATTLQTIAPRELRFVSVTTGTVVRHLSSIPQPVLSYSTFERAVFEAVEEVLLRHTRVLAHDANATPEQQRVIAEQCARAMVGCGEAPHVPLSVVEQLLLVIDYERARHVVAARHVDAYVESESAVLRTLQEQG